MGLRDRHLFKDQKCFFVTTTCNGHLHLFRSHSYFLILANSIEFLNLKYKSDILAYVFMPNHIHLIVYFKEENMLSEYMRDFKKYTAFRIRKEIESDGNTALLENLRVSNGKQIFKIWMDRFDDVFLETPSVLETKLDYIHFNPTKKNLCSDPTDYLYSSAFFYENDLQNNFPLEVIHYKKYF